MAKAKTKSTKSRYHVLTQPTMTSRVLTWILLLVVPVIAFFLGMKYQESNSNLQILEMKDQMLMEQLDTVNHAPLP